MFRDLQERLQNVRIVPWVEIFPGLIIASLVFGLIAFNRNPGLVEFGVNLRLNVRYVFAIGALLYLTLRLNGWPGRILSLGLISAWFALPLAGLWGSGFTHTTILSGLIPIHDASDYYTDALRLLSGLDYSTFSARRPLFAGSLAVLLVLTNHNLMAALAILGLISAIACYLAIKEVQHTHGAEAAAMTLALLFLFYRTHIGAAMSENIGFPLGVIGFALIWRGAAERKFSLIGLGLFVTTLALNARAGAFFTLPALILWSAWMFRDHHRRFSVKFMGMGIAIVLSGFLINFFTVRLLATPTGVPFANFSYSLYGLASGGQSWGHVFTVYPELDNMQEPEKTIRIYQLTFDLIRTHPDRLLAGTLRYWQAFLFSEPWYSAYSFMRFENLALNFAAHWMLYLLCLVGLAKLFRSPDDPFASLLGAGILGIFASVPFAPPSDAYFMRAYAASIIVISVLPATGLMFILESLKLKIRRTVDVGFSGLELSAWFSLLIILPMILGPLAVQSVGQIPKIPDVSCGTGLSFIYIRLDSGTAINVIDAKNDASDWMLNYSTRKFKRSAHALSDVDLILRLNQLEAPKALFYSLDFQSQKKALILIPSDLLPPPGHYLGICGTWAPEPELTIHSIFDAETVEMVAP